MSYYHVVKAGDTMYDIANLYQCHLPDLIEINKRTHPNPDLIHPGDKLSLPTSVFRAKMHMQVHEDMAASARYYDEAIEEQEKILARLKGVKSKVMNDHMTRLKAIQAGHYHVRYFTRITTVPDGYHDTKDDRRNFCEDCGAELNGIDRPFSSMQFVGTLNLTGTVIKEMQGGKEVACYYPGMNYA